MTRVKIRVRYVTDSSHSGKVSYSIMIDHNYGRFGRSSAGSCGRLSYHSHPSIEPLTLSSPLAGLRLVSPWVTSTVAEECAKHNSRRDLIDKAVPDKWVAYALGSAAQDEFNSPLAAAPDWWSDVSKAVKAILVTAGQGEKSCLFYCVPQ